MDAKQKLAERTEMFDNAFKFKHNKRVPTVSNFWTWPVLDAGYRLEDALYDYDVMEKIMDEYVERYQFDCYFDYLTRNPLRVTRLLGPDGGGIHRIADDGEQLYALDHSKMLREEYEEFVKDPNEVYYSGVFKRYCKPDIKKSDVAAALKEFFAFGAYSSKMVHKYIETDGALNYYGVICQPPFETIFDMLRGIKESSMDLRRIDHGLMKETLDILWAGTKPYLEGALKNPDPEGYIAPLTYVHLATSIMNEKQFEEYYWPYMKEFIDLAVANNKKISVLCESAILRFKDFLQDVPQGILMYNLEQDDPWEFRKELPNIAIAGGMNSQLLGYGTPQENIDYVKNAIDTLGDGLVLSQNKMGSFRADAKRENLLAVLDFVRTYEA